MKKKRACRGKQHTLIGIISKIEKIFCSFFTVGSNFKMPRDKDEIRAVVNCLTSGEEGSALWKVKKIYDLFNSLSPLYNALLSSGKIIRELDWDDPENIYALALDDYGGDMERRAKILMGDID